jgi:Tfp pilus assembly protein PilN
MRAVNLLPLDARAGRRRPPTAALAVAGVGVLAASVLVVGFVSANGTVDSRNEELAALEQQLAAARRAAKPKPAETGLSAERDQRFTALSGAMAERLAWDRILREVSLVLPDDVWLSSLAAGGTAATGATAGTPAATPDPQAGQTVTFNGFTYSQESVARLLTRLDLVPDLGDVKLQKSSVTTVGSQQIYGFTILADVISGGGTP